MPPCFLLRSALRRGAVACFVLALAGVAPATNGHAQPRRGSDLPRVSPNASVSQTIGVTDVQIRYGRPGVKGRDVFGSLVPYGKVWRTGANEATTITFSDDVHVEGQALAAGTYGLFTVPGRAAWTLVFNDTAEQWGAFDYDDRQDALRVEVAPQQAPRAHEQVSFQFEHVTDTSAVAVLAWDAVRVPFTIQTATDANIRAKADAADADDWRVPYQYAAYALEHGLYPEAALAWADRSVALKETFYNTSLKARLLASLERYAAAHRLAARAVAMADGLDEAPRGLASFKEQAAAWPTR